MASSYKKIKMFNLFLSNSTQESVTKKTSPVVTLPLSLFSKDEVKEFQRKVKLATLNNIAPTVSSVLNQDLTKAVEFLGWAEVSTEDDNQLTYPKDDKGMPVNIRKKGTNTQNVNKFADAFLDGSFSYAVEQPWGVFTRQECKPYLFIDAKGNLTVKNVRIDQYAGRTRRAGNEEANILLQKEPERLKVKLPTGEIKFFIAVLRFRKDGGRKASYWRILARGLENNPERQSGFNFIKEFEGKEDDLITIQQLVDDEGIDLNDESETNNRKINLILKDNLIKSDKYSAYRNKLRESKGILPVTRNYTRNEIIKFASGKNIKIVNMGTINNNLNKRPKDELIKQYLDQNGTVHLIWSFKGTGTLGVQDTDYDPRCFRACMDLLRIKGVREVVVVAHCCENTADHIRKIRNYKKNDMISDQVNLLLNDLKLLSCDEKFNEMVDDAKQIFDYSKIRFVFMPQIVNEDDSKEWC